MRISAFFCSFRNQQTQRIEVVCPRYYVSLKQRFNGTNLLINALRKFTYFLTNFKLSDTLMCGVNLQKKVFE